MRVLGEPYLPDTNKETSEKKLWKLTFGFRMIDLFEGETGM